MGTTILNTLKDGTQVTQVTGTVAVTVGNFPAGTAGLTNTELRATPVPVSGTVTANTGLSQPLTDAQLRAAVVPVTGGVANGATDSGNPIKAGAIYTVVNPAYSTGQRTNLRANITGELLVRRKNYYSHIVGNTTKLAKTGAGILGTVVMGTVASTSTITVYDGLDATGTIITILNPAGACSGTAVVLDCEFNTGLFIVTAGLVTNDVTVLYQ